MSHAKNGDSAGGIRPPGAEHGGGAQACEIRLRAERKAGQLLAKMEKAKGGRPSPKTPSPREGVSTLDDLGISEKQSHQWQKLAAVPQHEFDAALADPAARPTTAGIIRAAAEPKRNPVSAEVCPEIPPS